MLSQRIRRRIALGLIHGASKTVKLAFIMGSWLYPPVMVELAESTPTTECPECGHTIED